MIIYALSCKREGSTVGEHLLDHLEKLVIFASGGNSLFVVQLLIDLSFALVRSGGDQQFNSIVWRKASFQADSNTQANQGRKTAVCDRGSDVDKYFLDLLAIFLNDLDSVEPDHGQLPESQRVLWIVDTGYQVVDFLRVDWLGFVLTEIGGLIVEREVLEGFSGLQ